MISYCACVIEAADSGAMEEHKDVILTRAARKKGKQVVTNTLYYMFIYIAGYSPLPSLFVDGRKTTSSTPLTSSTSAGVSRHLAENSSSTSSSGEEEREGEGGRGRRRAVWVQCEHLHCRKWRRLPNNATIDTNRYVLGD